MPQTACAAAIRNWGYAAVRMRPLHGRAMPGDTFRSRRSLPERGRGTTGAGVTPRMRSISARDRGASDSLAATINSAVNSSSSSNAWSTKSTSNWSFMRLTCPYLTSGTPTEPEFLHQCEPPGTAYRAMPARPSERATGPVPERPGSTRGSSASTSRPSRTCSAGASWVPGSPANSRGLACCAPRCSFWDWLPGLWLPEPRLRISDQIGPNSQISAVCTHGIGPVALHNAKRSTTRAIRQGTNRPDLPTSERRAAPQAGRADGCVLPPRMTRSRVFSVSRRRCRTVAQAATRRHV